MLKKILMALVVGFSTSSLFAFWASEGPKRELETLVITANYKSPRLLADLIQERTRQPYILLPAGDTDTKIYFCTPSRVNQEISAEKLSHFVKLANPERILILGDEVYVPKKYEALLDENIPVIRVTGSDWGRISGQLGFMLAVSGLEKNFSRLQKEMLTPGRTYRPFSAPAVNPVSKKADVKKVAPIEPMEPAKEQTKSVEPAKVEGAAAEKPAETASEKPVEKK